MEPDVSPDALLMDVGFVILGITWDAIEAYDATTGSAIAGPPGEGHRRPIPPPGDPSTAEQYWSEVAEASGLDGARELMRRLAETVPDLMFDDGALSLMEDARRAGRRVGILSNDAYGFIGRSFFDGRPEFALAEVFIDSTDIGARKPEPAAYLAAANALAVAPERIVFLDDTPACTAGANAVGMVGIDVDPFDSAPAFDRARKLLGLGATGGA